MQTDTDLSRPSPFPSISKHYLIPIHRSANTGRSGFFNQRGDVLQQTEYWVPTAIKETLKANTKVTFYAKHGDYLSRIAVYLTFVLLITWIAKSLFDLGKNRKAVKATGTRKKK